MLLFDVLVGERPEQRARASFMKNPGKNVIRFSLP